MMRKTFLAVMPAFLLLGFTGPATAAVLFSDQMTNAAAWNINANDADFAATFNYNYSLVGIPEAPNTQAGDAATRGLKMEANIVEPGSNSFFTAYPIGQNFTGTYRLRFDAWMNYDADEQAFGGSAGTTELLGGGVGYDNAAADVTSGAQVIATGDGGSASDWRAFKDGFFVAAAEMAGGSRNGADPYYAGFLTSVAPPAVQGQSASGAAGSPSFQWITWQLTVLAEAGMQQVLVDILKPDGDALRIVTIDCADTSDGSSGCSTDGNISLFYGDIFSSVTDMPERTFGIIDNVVVLDAFDVPEPAMLVLLGLGLAALGFAARRHYR